MIVNFWGPSCVPCRDEFPLFIRELAAHQSDGLAIVGILMFDPPAPARAFIADYKATWPTIDDAAGTIRTAYRAVARPQTYFIDRNGILRGIQVGELTEADFARLYATISGPAGSAATGGAVARAIAAATVTRAAILDATARATAIGPAAP